MTVQLIHISLMLFSAHNGLNGSKPHSITSEQTEKVSSSCLTETWHARGSLACSVRQLLMVGLTLLLAQSALLWWVQWLQALTCMEGTHKRPWPHSKRCIRHFLSSFLLLDISPYIDREDNSNNLILNSHANQKHAGHILYHWTLIKSLSVKALCLVKFIYPVPPRHLLIAK